METPNSQIRHSVFDFTLLVINLVFAACACLEIAFVAPYFASMFFEFGAPVPPPTHRLLYFSNILTAAHHFGFVVVFCAAPWLMVRRYFTLKRHLNAMKLFNHLCLVFVCLLVLLGGITLIIFLPIFIPPLW